MTSHHWILSIGLVTALGALPAVGLAQGRPEPRREAPEAHPTPRRDDRGPGRDDRGPGRDDRGPGRDELPRRSPREHDARYESLRHQEAARMNEHERREWELLQARQHRLEELRRLDVERERTRLERARLARLRVEEHDHHKGPVSPFAHEEYARYSQRKAALLRAREISVAEGRVDAAVRAEALLGREELRHAAWVTAHNM